MSMSADDNRICPARNKLWNCLDNDRFTKDGAVQDVTDRTIRTLPHLFEFEFYFL